MGGKSAKESGRPHVSKKPQKKRRLSLHGEGTRGGRGGWKGTSRESVGASRGN